MMHVDVACRADPSRDLLGSGVPIACNAAFGVCVDPQMVAARLVGPIVLAVAVPAAAGPDEPPGFAWTAPAGCPPAAAVRARIEQRLGSTVDDTSLARIRISVERRGSEFVADISSDGDDRTLTGASCEELADAVAVIVARVARQSVVIQGPVEVAPPPVPRPEMPSPPRWRIGVRAASAATVGAVPGLGLAGEADAILRRGALALEAGYVGWRDADTTGAVAGDRLAVGLAALALRARWRPLAAPVEVWLVGEAGRMTAVGMSASDDHRLSGRWVAAGAGASVEWALAGEIGMFGAVEVVDAAERPQFQLADGTALYEPGRVSARVSVGCEARWP